MTFDVRLLNRALVGFDDFFNAFETRHANQLNTNYPPYNVIKFGENDYIIEMAVAGFKRDEITIELENDVLSIRGVKREDKTNATQYIYHGLGSRGFQRQFTLHNDLVIKDANLEDGILKVLILQVIPENKKPKLIKIN